MWLSQGQSVTTNIMHKLTQNAGKAHNLLQGPPSAPLISKYLFSLTWKE